MSQCVALGESHMQRDLNFIQWLETYPAARCNQKAEGNVDTFPACCRAHAREYQAMWQDLSPSARNLLTYTMSNDPCDVRNFPGLLYEMPVRPADGLKLLFSPLGIMAADVAYFTYFLLEHFGGFSSVHGCDYGLLADLILQEVTLQWLLVHDREACFARWNMLLYKLTMTLNRVATPHYPVLVPRFADTWRAVWSEKFELAMPGQERWWVNFLNELSHIVAHLNEVIAHPGKLQVSDAVENKSLCQL